MTTYFKFLQKFQSKLQIKKIDIPSSQYISMLCTVLKSKCLIEETVLVLLVGNVGKWTIKIPQNGLIPPYSIRSTIVCDFIQGSYSPILGNFYAKAAAHK